MISTRSAKISCAVVATIAYFLAAYWLTFTYRPRELTDQKMELYRPFTAHPGSGFAASIARAFFSRDADTADNSERSTLLLYEDGRPLRPAHSAHADIAKLGMGRFSHRKSSTSVIIFSSSDNSTPISNGRVYAVVKRSAATVPQAR